MKQPLIRFGAALAIEAAVFACAVWWQADYIGSAVGLVLFWPAIELARLGLHPTWPVLPLLALLLPVIAVISGRRRHFGVVALVTALLASLWCGVGSWNTSRLAHLIPEQNPYPAGSTNAVAFARGYGEGYSLAVTGCLSDYCFAPEDETAGFDQGQDDGIPVMNRMFGWPPTKNLRHVQGAVGIDGVSPPASPAPAP
jgi:hypothetical protein